MGLFGFVFKVGVVAYVYDWVTRRRIEASDGSYNSNSTWHGNWNSSHYWQNWEFPKFDDVAETVSATASKATESAEVQFPRLFHRAKELYQSQNAICGTIRHPTYWFENKDGSSSSVISVEVPGIKREDLRLSVAEDSSIPVICLAGASHVSSGCERKVDARIPLPRGADANAQITAKLEDGILKIEMGRIMEKKRIILPSEFSFKKAMDVTTLVWGDVPDCAFMLSIPNLDLPLSKLKDLLLARIPFEFQERTRSQDLAFFRVDEPLLQNDLRLDSASKSLILSEEQTFPFQTTRCASLEKCSMLCETNPLITDEDKHYIRLIVVVPLQQLQLKQKQTVPNLYLLAEVSVEIGKQYFLSAQQFQYQKSMSGVESLLAAENTTPLQKMPLQIHQFPQVHPQFYQPITSYHICQNPQMFAKQEPSNSVNIQRFDSTTHLSSNSSNSDSYFCQWNSSCSCSYPTCQELIVHIDEVHIGRKKDGNLCLDCLWPGCPVSKGSRTKRDHIIKHMWTHMNERPFSCSHCDKRFKRRQDAKKHESKHHDIVSTSSKSPLRHSNHILEAPNDSFDKKFLTGAQIKQPDQHLYSINSLNPLLNLSQHHPNINFRLPTFNTSDTAHPEDRLNRYPQIPEVRETIGMRYENYQEELQGKI
ncbi:hypothetical protein HK096_003809 [Nowakowskiella sp. JEL0078]|nr:hypothetical protein HK096_003809 [Nowakowskiella sp. JEL0078]